MMMFIEMCLVDEQYCIRIQATMAQQIRLRLCWPSSDKSFEIRLYLRLIVITWKQQRERGAIDSFRILFNKNYVVWGHFLSHLIRLRYN